MSTVSTRWSLLLPLAIVICAVTGVPYQPSSSASTTTSTNIATSANITTSYTVLTSTSHKHHHLHSTTSEDSSDTASSVKKYSSHEHSDRHKHHHTTSSTKKHSSHHHTTSATSYALAQNISDDVLSIPDFVPKNNHSSYLDSPRCTSELLSYYNITTVPTDAANQYTWVVPAGQTLTTTIKPKKYNRRTFTLTGPTTTIYTDTNAAATGGPVQGCCGVCSIVDYYVDINYWPQPNAKTNCVSTMKPEPRTRPGINRKPSNKGNIPIPYSARPAVTARAIQPQVQERDASGLHTSVGKDGFVYTSPYVYVVYESIWAKNKCGWVGGMYTSLTWSFLPDELSTVDKWGYTVPFDFGDLPCRPQATRYTDGYYHEATLAAVPQLNLVDPAFKNCWVGFWEGVDPPFAFQAQSQLVPTTNAAPSPTPHPAEPQSMAAPPAVQTSAVNAQIPNAPPAPTINSEQTVQTPVPAEPVNAPFESPPENIPGVPVSPGQIPTLLPVSPDTVPSMTPAAALPPVPAPFPIPLLEPIPAGQTASPAGDSNAPQPDVPAVEVPGDQFVPAPQGPTVATSSPTVPFRNEEAQQAYMVDGQTLISTGNGFVIGKQSLVPGGRPITIDGKQFALEPFTVTGPTGPLQTSFLVVGHKTYAIPEPAHPSGTDSVNGHPIASDAASNFQIGNEVVSIISGGSDIVYHGSTIERGQSVTIDGTIVRLGDGFIVEGTRTEMLDALLTQSSGGIGAPSSATAVATATGPVDEFGTNAIFTPSPTEAAVTIKTGPPSSAASRSYENMALALKMMLANVLVVFVLSCTT